MRSPSCSTRALVCELANRRFFGSSLRRVPSSWVRFLWFMACLAIAAFSLIVGQGELNRPLY